MLKKQLEEQRDNYFRAESQQVLSDDHHEDEEDEEVSSNDMREIELNFYTANGKLFIIF